MSNTGDIIIQMSLWVKNYPSGPPSVKDLATYVMKVYASMWFSIKRQSSCKDGARHIFCSIQLSDTCQQIMDPVIKRNRYFGHPENLLLAMISDQREYVRELGLRRILKARTLRAGEQGTVRQFCVPKMNLNATNYFELIDWHDVTNYRTTLDNGHIG